MCSASRPTTARAGRPPPPRRRFTVSRELSRGPTLLPTERVVSPRTCAGRHPPSRRLVMSIQRILVAALVALGAVGPALADGDGAADQAAPDWENPRVFGRNKLPPRNAAWPCPDAISAWSSNYDSSPWVRSLN